MPEKATKIIFADVSADMANKFLAKAKASGTTGQALVESWATDYLGEKRATIPDADKKWMEKLEYILRNGDASTRSAVTNSLALFERLVRITAGK